MHPQGSTDILLAAGGGFQLSFAFLPQSLHFSLSHCLSVTLISFTSPKFLKQLIYVRDLLSALYILTVLSVEHGIFALPGLVWAIFCYGDGWALLISVFTKQIEDGACTHTGASLQLGAEGKTESEDGPYPKRLTCHRPAPSGQARVCDGDRGRVRNREWEKNQGYHRKIHARTRHEHAHTYAASSAPKPGDSPYLKQALKQTFCASPH